MMRRGVRWKAFVLDAVARGGLTSRIISAKVIDRYRKKKNKIRPKAEGTGTFYIFADLFPTKASCLLVQCFLPHARYNWVIAVFD